MWIGASKPSCVKLDFVNPPLPRQIGQPAHVVTVDAARLATATWTARFHRLRLGNKHDPVRHAEEPLIARLREQLASPGDVPVHDKAQSASPGGAEM